jgi:hypothetical protein
MASKKTTSQAQKAASKSSSNKGKTGKKVEPKTEDLVFHFPPRVISSAICAGLFILFLVIFMNQDGALTKLLYHFLLGLFGEVCFYVSIPALLYMFIIQAFSGKRPVIMRSISLGVFVLLCGCIAHLMMPDGELGRGGAFVKALYMGGIHGTTGGLICGILALLLRWLCGKVIALLLFILAAVVTLLGAMQITIPSIIRAVQNRPRADWEDEEEEVQEPAAVVVNHLANKRIEHMEHKRRVQEERQRQARELEQELQKNPAAPATKQPRKTKAEEMLAQIEEEPDRPVAAAEKPVPASLDDSIFTPVAARPKKVLTEDIPAQMPELDMDTLPEVIPMAMPEIKRPEPEPVAPESAIVKVTA